MVLSDSLPRAGTVLDVDWSKIGVDTNAELEWEDGPCAPAFAWELRNGPIPTGMCVRHLCAQHICVRPDHFFLGTLKGEYHCGAKLTENEVKEIRLAAAQGLLHRDLAEVYGVRPSTISQVVSRRNWRHVLPQCLPTFHALLSNAH